MKERETDAADGSDISRLQPDVSRLCEGENKSSQDSNARLGVQFKAGEVGMKVCV